jgi:hypothetical protein
MKTKPFIFKTELWIPQYTGIKVTSIKEFIEALKVIDKFSIFYHMYINIFNYHNLPVYYTNSFAHWFYKNNYLLLAEKISIIDPMDYYDLEELRKDLVAVLEKNYKEFYDLEELKKHFIEVLEKKSKENFLKKTQVPFYFIKADRCILEYGEKATNLEEFIEGIKKSSINSLFYHLVTSRIENRTLLNDYSAWLFNIGEAKKAELISKLDLYTMNLYEIKKEIIKILES